MYLGGGAAQARELTNNNNSSNVRSAEDQEKILNRARQIMEEQNVDQATALAIAEAQGLPQQPEVRAPIAPTTTRLIGGDYPVMGQRHITGHDLMMQSTEREMETMRRQMRRNVEQGGLSIAFNNSNTTDTSESEPLSPSNATHRPTNLQDLFSPPVDILYQGSWEQTREMAKENNKWILANIQKDSEFLSYNLNRDIWCNEIVKELISSNFIFFQHDETTSEAQKYKTLYNPANLPHIAIVDPFTGEQMIEIELAPYQSDSADMLAAFLEVTNGFLEANVLEGAKRKKMQERLLERQLENQINGPNSSSPVSRQPPVAIDLTNDQTKKVDADVQMLDDIEKLEPEPANGPDTLTIQFKLFGAKAVKRRFKKEDKVSTLFAFARSLNEEARTRAFDLVTYPNKSLKKFEEATLVEQRLANGTVIGKFVDNQECIY